MCCTLPPFWIVGRPQMSFTSASKFLDEAGVITCPPVKFFVFRKSEACVFLCPQKHPDAHAHTQRHAEVGKQ